MKFDRTATSEWVCIVSGSITIISAIVWFFGIRPNGLWFPLLALGSAITCAALFYLGKTAEHRIPKTKEPQKQLTESPEPDTSIKDSDPQLEIKIADLRGKIVSDEPNEQACFDLINRGKQSAAKFACIEDFYIGGYYVAFRAFPPPIKPFGNHDSITPLYINNPDGKLSHYNIFEVFLYAWHDLKNPKLYEYSIPIKVVYQDDARNLFELRCDLVFYPSEHADRSRGEMNNKVIETKNQRIRKVAPALPRINWTD